MVRTGVTSPFASPAWTVIADGWNAPERYSPTSVTSGSYGEYGRICVQLPWFAVKTSLCASS